MANPDHIGKVFSGIEFNVLYKGIKLYKFLNDSFVHRGLKYKKGLNVDNLTFDSSGDCGPGLYFCKESDCRYHWRSYGKKLAFVEIPDDAQVYIERFKFKADKLFITQILDFVDVPDDFWYRILPHDGYVLSYIKNITEIICRAAVTKTGGALKFVPQNLLTEEVCRLAVKDNGYALQYVINQTDEICELAVKRYGLALEFVKNQTETICRLAVEQTGLALQFVINPTYELCVIAIDCCGTALRYVDNTTGYLSDSMMNELYKMAIKRNGLTIQYVNHQTEELCIMAVKQDRDAVNFVNPEFRRVCYRTITGTATATI